NPASPKNNHPPIPPVQAVAPSSSPPMNVIFKAFLNPKNQPLGTSPRLEFTNPNKHRFTQSIAIFGTENHQQQSPINHYSRPAEITGGRDSPSGINCIDNELTQCRVFFGVNCSPTKTCPKCPSQ